MRRKLRVPNRKSPIANRSAGLTLTEVIIASALLVIALVPILKALTRAHVTATIIEHRTRSLTLAQAKLDDLKARSIYNYGTDFTENNSSVDGAYLCNVTDTGSGTDLRTVAVSVGYDLSSDSVLGSGETDVTLTTLLARRW
ncbi:MAG: type IV pilus modification PilV family protein [Planctomycetota bacterium]|jgi:Tfp pilus assembly protein PilV